MRTGFEPVPSSREVNVLTTSEAIPSVLQIALILQNIWTLIIFDKSDDNRVNRIICKNNKNSSASVHRTKNG